MVFCTNSCQFSPAFAVTKTWFSSVICSVIPFKLSFITKPSKSLVKSKLLPPPKIRRGECESRSVSLSSSTELTSAKYFVLASTPKVLYCCKEKFSWIFIFKNRCNARFLVLHAVSRIQI